MDRSVFGGHSELVFDGCFVPATKVLGEVDRGFELAQLRLAPARLTHCMRWLGIARRSQDIAIRYAADRHAFGRSLTDQGMLQKLVADSDIDIEVARALIYRCAWQLDNSDDRSEAGYFSSITKVFVSEAVGRVVDRAVQICGATGISEDILLSRYFREVRAFRIYDGPSETHRWSISRRAVRMSQRSLD
jgi:acyl-CoA dehydrogenase